MEHPVADFLGPALVPELGSDIAAGPAGHRQFILVLVAAIGAFPHQFSGSVFFDLDFAVKPAAFAIVAFGVEFGVHDIVIDELHYA